jgi:hypothetical protein
MLDCGPVLLRDEKLKSPLEFFNLRIFNHNVIGTFFLVVERELFLVRHLFLIATRTRVTTISSTTNKLLFKFPQWPKRKVIASKCGLF